MAKIRLTCENCGFGEELSEKQLKERSGKDGGLACSACGAALTLPEGAAPSPKKDKPAKKARYAGLDAMTGLDDVLEDEIAEEAPAETTPFAAAEKAPATAPAEEAPAAPQAEEDQNAEKDKDAVDEAEGAPSPENAEPEEAAGQQAGPARGMAGQAAGAAKEKIKKTVLYGRENPLFAAEILDRIFRGIAACAGLSFDRIAQTSLRIGHYTLLAAAALALIFGMLVSLRSLSLYPLLTGLTLAAALLFAQYLALRGFELLEGYIYKTPSRLPSAAIADILSAFSVLAGLLSLLTGLILTINFYSPVWLGLAALGLIVGYFAAGALMACRLCLNVSFDAGLPVSETIVELVLLILKTTVAVVPFIFGLGSAAMALCMIWPVVSMLLFNLNTVNTASFFLQESGLLFCAFSPIMAYFFILLWTFIIQIARGLLGPHNRG